MVNLFREGGIVVLGVSRVVLMAELTTILPHQVVLPAHNCAIHLASVWGEREGGLVSCVCV